MSRALIILPITRHEDTKSQCRNYSHLARAKYFTLVLQDTKRKETNVGNLKKESPNYNRMNHLVLRIKYFEWLSLLVGILISYVTM